MFTRKSNDLVIEGQQWMKAIAYSDTITKAFVTTLEFAMEKICDGSFWFSIPPIPRIIEEGYHVTVACSFRILSFKYYM